MRYHVYVEESSVYHVIVEQSGPTDVAKILEEANKKIRERNCGRVGREVRKPVEIYEESTKKQVWSR